MKRKHVFDGLTDDRYCYGRALPWIARLRRFLPWL
jgi:hypothetical protein